MRNALSYLLIDLIRVYASGANAARRHGLSMCAFAASVLFILSITLGWI